MTDDVKLELLRNLANSIDNSLIDDNVIDFAITCQEMTELYAKKNHDYGDSFTKGMDTIGLAYGVGRLYDKMNRIITLMKVKPEITDEGIEDTIKDLACYAVMTSVYIANKKYSKLNDVDFEGTSNAIPSTGEQK